MLVFDRKLTYQFYNGVLISVGTGVVWVLQSHVSNSYSK